ncbi:MAG: chemotaxis-specific protein-glutamate methyltransferase CheB [Pseudomonadota bacterium]
MTRLLIVDDSPLMRRLLLDIFTKAGGFEIEAAKNGVEAIELLHRFKPEVVTLDIHMPDMDGLECLDRIMVERPTPVVMISALTAEGADETLEAMALGAIDFIGKPHGPISIEIEGLTELLIEKVRSAAQVKISRATRLADRVRLRSAAPQPQKVKGKRAALSARTPRTAKPLPGGSSGEGLVIIGTSTGGPAALDVVLAGLPADFPWPVVVAQHMPRSFTGALARRLDRFCALTVVEVAKSELLLPGHAYIGRGDADLLISRRGGLLIALAAPSKPELHWHPSVDRLVESAMQYLGPERLIGVLMTGMGNDGAREMTELAHRGGHTIAEAEETAVVWGMPGALVTASGADHIEPLDAIAGRLNSLVGR